MTADTPKQIILQVAADAREAVSMLEDLKDVVLIEQVEAIQKKLSSAANGMTRVRTWMVENCMSQSEK